MKEVEIEDLIPEDATITLGGKEYEMRKFNVEDEVWLKKTFGKGLQLIFQGLEYDQISRIIFRQLKDKTDFMPTEEEALDDDGYKITKKITGPDMVLRKICGMKEKNEAIYSIVQLLGVSRPIMDKLVEQEMEEKKKVLEQMMATNQEIAGRTSTTESQASTVTQ